MLTAYISLRCTERDKERVKAAAKAQRRTVSEWLLMLVEEALEKDAKP